MSLAAGTRLGVYEVLEPIGAGGMGEVYRARDTKLQRDVALKSLPELFAIDPERLARFRREAQVLASLNHPHIGSIYGFEEGAGVHALVLELVPGPTLADRIAQGALPIDEAIVTAGQIIDALDAAHAQGIVHRDLKPANVKIRPDGTVKVLDFGLARAIESDPASVAAIQTPTITSPAMTQRGIILGTAAYMSPEQARGKVVDKRSDIWAFGAVVFEMLTGKRAFEGEEISDTLANVLRVEPDWKALPSNTPEAIRRLLRRCLEKDPKCRLHDISDARLELAEPDSVEAAVAVAAPGTARERLAWATLALSLAGVLAYMFFSEPRPTEVLRFHVSAPEQSTFGSSSGIGRLDGTSGASLSPDGTQLIFGATMQTGATQLWLRRLDSLTSRRLDGTDNGMMAFWSPDSKSIGFFSGGKLKTLQVADGSVQTICDVATPPRGGTWGSLDQIVFSAGVPPKMLRVPARGGVAVPIASIEGPMPRWPSFLADGRHFLYWAVVPSTATSGLFVGSTESGFVPRHIVATDSNGRVASNHLIYARGDALVRQAFDDRRLQVTGEATPIAELVLRSPAVGRADFTVSESGVLAYRAGVNLPTQFAWFDRSGKFIQTVGPPGNYRTPDLSPDGSRVAFTDVNARDIWILDLERGTSSRFTSSPLGETAPAWFPDGKKIVYRADGAGLFEKDVTGTGTEVKVWSEPVAGPSQVSADGKWIVYFAIVKDRAHDIFVMPTTGDRKPQSVIATPFAEVEPQLSPDGRWLAYASNETGRYEIYVQPFPTTGTRWQVSNAGGRQATWRKDGKELFFVADEGAKFYAVDIVHKPDRFDFGVPRFLFDMRANVFNTLRSYIPSPDGQRFLINMTRETANSPINIVHNWTADIDKR